MIPQRRISTLLHQALTYQRDRCLYHNAALPSPYLTTPSSRRKEYSLYTDHLCDTDAFPRVTTMILEGHKDEVWNIVWSHSGLYLASGGKDQRALIWKIGVRSFSFVPGI
jgi:WD40 repeat protein